MIRCAVFLVLVFLSAHNAAAETFCEPVLYEDGSYTVCQAPSDGDIRLFLNRKSGKPFFSFEAVDAALAEDNKTLAFAMNGGMYHEDRRPVGYYVEAGVELAPLNTTSRYGNFGLVPNGVFYIADGRAGVMETEAFAASRLSPTFATQSGPMLVINGKLHPKFNADGSSRKKRNGVGLSADGKTIWFAISEEAVNFYSFASLFKDQLGCDNALFLDGTVSRLYDPSQGRSDPGLPMGPIIGLVTSQTED